MISSIMDSWKWKKYQLFVSFGLIKPKDLDACVTRYDIKDYEKCLDDVKSEIKDNKHYGSFVSLVPLRKIQNLPSMRTKTINEVEQARKKLSKMDLSDVSGIWFKRIKKGNAKHSFWGRQSLMLDDMFPRILSSDLELLNMKGGFGRALNFYPYFKSDYVRLRRIDRFPFEITEMHAKDTPSETLCEVSNNICNKLSRYQRSIFELGEFVKSCDVRSMSIDFYCEDEKMTFIDWDSGDDSKIMTKLEQRMI